MKKKLLVGALVPVVAIWMGIPNATYAATTQKASITFGGWGIPTQIAAYQKEVAAFEKLNPNITVNTQFLPWTGNETKLITENASQTLPDVMVTSSAWFTEFASKGSYLNLSPYFKSAKYKASNFAPGGIVGNSINGKLYMIPSLNAYPGGQVVILYNKSMFSKAHISPPSPNWTLKDFEHVSQELTLDANGKNATQHGFDAKHIVQWGTNAGQSVADNIWDELLPAYGGWYWNGKKTQSTIDSPAGEKVAQYLQQLVTSNASMPPAAAAGIADPFAAGKVAMSYFWTNTAESEVTSVNFPVAAVQLPVGPDGRGIFKSPANSGAVTNGWTIAANTKYPAASWKFVQFLATSPVAMKARGVNGVEQDAYAPLNSTWLKMLSPTDRQISQVDHAQYLEAPTKALAGWGAEYAEFWQDMGSSLQSYYLGKTSIGDALSTVQNQANQLLKQDQ